MKKTLRTTGWMLVLMMTAGGLLAAADPLVGSVTVHRATGKIFVDGNLDEPDWARVPVVGTFRVYPTDVPETSEAGDTTEIRMLWDNDNLYVAFKANDRDILATRTRRQEDVYNDDCVEVFVSPFADNPAIYTNIEINALGTYLSEVHQLKPSELLRKLPGVRDSDYSARPNVHWFVPGLQIGRLHQGTMNNESDVDSWWVIEESIPFSSFKYLGMKSKPKIGDVWRFNLYRIGGKLNPPRRNLFFIPEPLSNHSPQYFGRLIFGK